MYSIRMPCHVYSVCVPPFNQNAAVDRGHMFISAMHYAHHLLKCLCCQGEDATGAAAEPQESRGLANGSGIVPRFHGRQHGQAGLGRQDRDPARA